MNLKVWTDYIRYGIYAIELVIIFIVSLVMKLKNNKLKKENVENYNTFSNFVDFVFTLKNYIVYAEQNKTWSGKEKLDYVTKMIIEDANKVGFKPDDIKGLVDTFIDFSKSVNYKEKEVTENGGNTKDGNI